MYVGLGGGEYIKSALTEAVGNVETLSVLVSRCTVASHVTKIR
jgi:hypothetical protein